MWLTGICVVFLLPSIILGRVPHKTPDGRIIGGKEVDPKYSAKYVVALLDSNPRIGAHLCGGSLISRNYVLTAAHCVKHSTELEVALGVHNWTFREPTQVRYVVGKSNFTIHERYGNGCTKACDIAVIRLPETVGLNEYIGTIKLSGDVITSSKKAKTYGWGCTDVDLPHPNFLCSFKYHSQVLRYADVEVKAEPDHKNNYNRTNLKTDVDVDGQGVCLYDSGGPLVADGIQIGINDYVHARTRPEQCLSGIDGYVAVPYHLQWIKDHTDLE